MEAGRSGSHVAAQERDAGGLRWSGGIRDREQQLREASQKENG